MKKKKMIVGWLLVILLMGIIYYFSNQESVQSSNTSSGITKVIFDLFDLDSLFEFESFHSLIRKLAHFSVYALLGFLLYNAIFYTKKMDYINILVLAIFLVFLYACSDEVHQLFVYGRSGEIRDVIIDSSGGSIGAIIYYFYLKIGCVKDDL